MVKFRKYFTEEEPAPEVCANASWSTFAIPDYYEDQSGRALSRSETVEIITGETNWVEIPPGTPKPVLKYLLSDKSPIPIREIELSDDDIRRIGYFVRDCRELASASFFRSGPGNYSSSKDLQTSATDEEIRSFVTVFRRLYMTREDANFLKAATIVSTALDEHPAGTLISDWAAEYETGLEAIPRTDPFFPSSRVTFNRKQLLDVYIYTQYAHQPRKDREKQYHKFLDLVDGNKDLLYWLFLTEIWKSTLNIVNAGKMIEDVFRNYCTLHRRSPNNIDSVERLIPGIGAGESNEQRRHRLLKSAEDRLATNLWVEADKPPGGPLQFIEQARSILQDTMG